MAIEWSQVAFDDVLAIRDYIALDSPFYADHFIDKLMAATEKLADHPEIGRLVPEADNPDIRELIFHSYRIMYLLHQDKNQILIITVYTAVVTSKDMSLSLGRLCRLNGP